MGFSEAYDQIRTELQTLFSTYNEVDNPYDIEKNADIELKNSYGVSIGAGSNITRTMRGRADILRDFEIVLCRRANATRNDTATRITTEKAIFEDLTNIVKRFESKIPNVTRARYTSDSGVEFLGAERYNYYILRSIFEVEYSEVLT
jgi:hypothetical protein